MTAADLLADLEAAGYTLRVDDAGRLLLSPASRLTPADRAAIGQHKPALIWLLTDRHLGDYKHGDAPVEMVDVRIDLGDGRLTLGNAAQWDAFSAWAAQHNDGAALRWSKSKHNQT
jgi:hypothetical protein